MAKRKLWETRTDILTHRRHESRAATYRYVENERRNYACKAIRFSVINVYVDERDGRGWQLYERINLAEEASSE